MWRRDGVLLVQWAGYGHRHPAYLVEEASAKVLLAVPEAECTSFGPSPGTIVTSTEADVQVMWMRRAMASSEPWTRAPKERKIRRLIW